MLVSHPTALFFFTATVLGKKSHRSLVPQEKKGEIQGCRMACSDSLLPFLKKKIIYCVYERSAAYMCTACIHISCPKRSEEGIRAYGTEGLDSCELPCECRELNLNSLQEH